MKEQEGKTFVSTDQKSKIQIAIKTNKARAD
jgi:hypothetical protein